MNKLTYPKNSIIALLILTSLLTTGCTVLSKELGEPITADQSNQLKENETTAIQTIKLLGPPTHMSALPSGMVMAYEYIDAEEDQLGFNMDFIGIQWFKMAFGRAKAKHDTLLLIYNNEGLLRARDFQNTIDDLGKGFAFQFIITAMPTVDTKYLNIPPEQLTWGRLSLQRLPVTLNSDQSLVSGEHGIEARGTPDSVGQHTLEMQTPKRRKNKGE